LRVVRCFLVATLAWVLRVRDHQSAPDSGALLSWLASTVTFAGLRGLTYSARVSKGPFRTSASAEILPVVNPYWERGEFPFELVPRIAALNIVGDTMVGYGTTPMSAVGAGLLSYELSRVDGSIATFFAVHVGLAMQSIYLLGSEEQRQRWLPPMARLERIGAFALTSPITGPTRSSSRPPPGATAASG
jgi:hypothetical protein